jgi:hypothetical protein
VGNHHLSQPTANQNNNPNSQAKAVDDWRKMLNLDDAVGADQRRKDWAGGRHHPGHDLYVWLAVSRKSLHRLKKCIAWHEFNVNCCCC